MYSMLTKLLWVTSKLAPVTPTGVQCLEYLAEECQNLSIFYLTPKGIFNEQIILTNLLSWNSK